jgi:hypothetical protein
MARSTEERPVVVARVSFERTRLGPQCLVEAYARLMPIARKAVRRRGAEAKPVAAAARPVRPIAMGRAEHG